MDMNSSFLDKITKTDIANCIAIMLAFTALGSLEGLIIYACFPEFRAGTGEFITSQVAFGLTGALLLLVRKRLYAIPIISKRFLLKFIIGILPIPAMCFLGQIWGPIPGKIFGMTLALIAVFYSVMFIFIGVAEDSRKKNLAWNTVNVLIFAIFGAGAGLLIAGVPGGLYYEGGELQAFFTDSACTFWCPRLIFIAVNAAILAGLITRLKSSESKIVRPIALSVFYAFSATALIFIIANLIMFTNDSDRDKKHAAVASPAYRTHSQMNISGQDSIYKTFFGRFI